MADELPKYENPPIVETVLSAQFARLSKFRTAHAGVFCESHLGKEWSHIEEQPRIDDYFERFGSGLKWGPAGGGIRFTSLMEPQRTQIIGSDVSRMIQVQDSRFIYNWKKAETGAYPSYSATRTEFARLYARFGEFLKSHSLGEIEENQWEVTYMSHLLKGGLWESPDDWITIFPWLSLPQNLLAADGVQVNWDLVLPGQRGRLHVRLYFGRTSAEGPEAINVGEELVARGPASKADGFSVADGFEIGHEAIVRTFTAMTSDIAHKHWNRSL